MVEIRHRETGRVLETIEGESLVGADLRDMRLNGADLRGVDLRRANLESSDLLGADLSGADLTDAILVGAHLKGARLSQANLTRARLGSEHPSRAALLNGADLSHATLLGADLRNTEARLANLQGANLANSDMRGADFNGANLCHVMAPKALFIKCNLRETNLCGADLRDSHLNDANLVRASLHDADLSSTYPGGFTVINDAYNANPRSTEAAILTLSEMGRGRRTLAVLGQMAELGPESRRYHREAGKLASRQDIDIVISVGKDAGDYARAALEEGHPRGSVFLCRDLEEAAGVLSDILEPGDVVLLKASRVAGFESLATALAGSGPHGGGPVVNV